MPSLTTRTARSLALILAVLVAAACRKSDAPAAGDSTAGSGAAAGTPLPLAGAAPSAAALPGALVKDIDSYSGDELYAFVRGLSFVGSSTRDRKCRDSAGCAAAKKVKVTVAAVDGQDSIGLGVLPPFGAVAVQALNKGDAIEAMYGFQPDSKKLEYYLIVTRTDSATMRWRLEELDTKASPRTHRKVKDGTLTGCGHEWYAGARADFKSCAQASSMHRTRDGNVMTLSLLQTTGDPPLWLTCDQGCCTAGEP